MDNIDKVIDNIISEEKFKIGDRVRVVFGSGIDSRKEGAIVSDPNSKWVKFKTDDGEVVTMLKSRLVKATKKTNESIQSEIEDFVYDYWEDAAPALGGETEEALEQFKLHVMDRLSDKYGDQWSEVRPIAQKIVAAFNG